MKTLKTKWMLAAMLLMAFTFAACSSDDDDEKGDDAPKSQTQTITVGGVSFNMIAVEGGTFLMGSPESDAEAYDDEKPQHEVTLSNYYIGETVVTQELWEAVMGSNPSEFKGPKQPVDKVSWDDCQEFINKLNEKTGKTFRLPTEAEWEYAARGGKKSKGYTYSGSNTLDDVAWYGKNSNNETHDVALKAPNELGIYDMSGNVWEWCQDWFGKTYYENSSSTDPQGPASGSDRVLRGGSWENLAWRCRVAYRRSGSPDCRYNYYGLRLVLAPKSQNQAITVGGVSFNMIAVEGGTFLMGSPESDTGARADEKPQHEVTLSNYYIGETEVTQELWKAVMGSNPSGFKGSKLPVEKVSWKDCQEFIGKLNAQTGKTFRLPTEAEWEYAARGGKKSKGYTYSGSNAIGNVAWYEDNSGNTTHEVALKIPNELGIYDMTGNVWEWCQDWYGKTYYENSSTTDPHGPVSGTYRVLRGGGWFFIARNCRVAIRYYNELDVRDKYSGLRLVLAP